MNRNQYIIVMCMLILAGVGLLYITSTTQVRYVYVTKPLAIQRNMEYTVHVGGKTCKTDAGMYAYLQTAVHVNYIVESNLWGGCTVTGIVP